MHRKQGRHACALRFSRVLFWRTFDNNGKACDEIYRSHERMYSRGKDCSKKNYLLERVDSRVQHTWRLRVMAKKVFALFLMMIVWNTILFGPSTQLGSP